LFQVLILAGALKAGRRPDDVAPIPSADSSWPTVRIVVERECAFEAPSLPRAMRLVFQRRTVAGEVATVPSSGVE
jgi:hypothetical protein